MKLVKLPMIIIMLLHICCVGEKPPLAVWRISNDKEYRITRIGVLCSNEFGKMYLVRYISQNVLDKNIREQEYLDIYTYVAKNYDLSNYDCVGLEAVPKGEFVIGCSKATGHRDSKTIEEIMQIISREK